MGTAKVTLADMCAMRVVQHALINYFDKASMDKKVREDLWCSIMGWLDLLTPGRALEVASELEKNLQRLQYFDELTSSLQRHLEEN